jgi:mevalonate kinase
MDISSRTQVCASAPGKVVIFGEHFVLYNNEAIVAAINRRCFGIAEPTKDLEVRIESNLEMYNSPCTKEHATKSIVQASRRKLLEPLNAFCQNILKKYAPEVGLQIHIKSELIVGAGLGSSAASCVMLAGILRSIIAGKDGKEISSIDRKWIFENALDGEQMIHNKSSGVDCYVSTYGGLVHFASSTGTSGITTIENQPLPLFLINTHKSHETSELVSHVRRLSRNRPKYFNEIASDASAISATGIRAIGKGSLEEIGRLMTDNHKLLRKVGVSNKEIEKIIGICLRCGALGAKITGAGGGGCILVLARPETISALNAALNGLNLCSEAIGIAKDGILVN